MPFCARKCDYCAFFSGALEGGLADRYVRALTRELELRRPGVAPRLETVFFGGGTPSLLTIPQWEEIGRTMDRLRIRPSVEWTVECNPATVSPDKARVLRAIGVNRVSMGVQSLDEDLLERLGRVHTREMVFRSFEVLRSAGFDNVNLDLMFAIPGQTMDAWRATLSEALAMGSEHLACYEVIYEEDTPLFAQLRAGRIHVDEDLAAAMYDTLIEAADAAGLRQYEVANFARDDRAGSGAPANAAHPRAVPRFACRHNVNYWRGGAYAAAGPSASGFEGGVRYRNVSDTRTYCARLEGGELPIEWREDLPPAARAGEIAAFGLRMNAGWTWDAFRDATGFDLREEWDAEMRELAARGWGVRESDGFRLSAEGMRFADAAGSEFLRLACA